jgi:hypothetical protein
LDGVEVDILRVNVLVRAVLVPHGHHYVDFSYRPWSFRIGALVSFATAGLLVASAGLVAVLRK